MKLTAVYTLWGKTSTLDGDEFLIEGRTPTKAELSAIDVEAIRLEVEYKNMQYRRDRAKEYAKLNQDELRFDDMMNGTTTWKDAILAIKAKYPKP